MPVKSTRFKTQTIFDGEITGLNEREKNVLKNAGIGGGDVPKNVLVAPTGLTKTELVGVGTNGQENIEIGDNLILANGKLSATGGSGGDAFDVITLSEDGTTYTGTITGDKPVLIVSFGQTILTRQSILKTPRGNGIVVYNITPEGQIDNSAYINGTVETDLRYIYHYHFIKLTSSTDTFYFTYQNTSNDKLNTLDSLKKELNGKSLLCNGHSDDGIAEYVSGEDDGNISIGIVNMSTHASSKIIIDSTYTITDKVSPIE